MNKLVDFTNCTELKWGGYNGANGLKKSIIYNNKIQMLKVPKTDYEENNGAINEYICCHIYESIGIKTQKTILGTYTIDGKTYFAVACEDFILNEKTRTLDLKDFASFKNQVVHSTQNGYGTELEDVENTINSFEMMSSAEIKEHFWNMFIVDALLGNFDRHNGNWGFIVDRDTHKVEIAPVYDCASCLYPKLPEITMQEYMNDEELKGINERIYVFPTSALKSNGVKINYYDFINSMQNEDCNKALLRIMPQISMEKINQIIDETPAISDIRKNFYKTMLQKRYEKILEPAYQKVISKNSNILSEERSITDKTDIENDLSLEELQELLDDRNTYDNEYEQNDFEEDIDI